MTADLKFEVERHPDVLLVPNAALRWKPQPSEIAPEHRRKQSGGAAGGKGAPAAAGPGKGAPAAAGPGKGTSAANPPGGPQATPGGPDAKPRAEHNRVWVKEGQFVRPVRVQVGQSDGAMTEVSGEGLKEGLEVVIGESRSAAADDGGEKNPFLPTLRPSERPEETITVLAWN